ncbi:MAG: hypothetical protein MZV49_17710 [Rhodopseudomonas palustris]|nr:hypothetical protein [Rhodopseudomonas palustris]
MIDRHPGDAARCCSAIAINTDPQAPADRAASQADTASSRRAHRSRRWRTPATSASPTRRATEAEADAAAGDRRRCSSSSTIPRGLRARGCVRGERPALLVAADATDPVATGYARRRAGQHRADRLAARPGRLAARRRRAAPFEIRRPSRATTPRRSRSYNIVPGLIGVILTHDHGDDHRAGDDARARARHDGEPAVHAGHRRSR